MVSQEILDPSSKQPWMDQYPPIQCGKRLWICPTWQSPPKPEAVNLRLDPGLAFGSGSHPTTFLCLQWLDSMELQGATVVDYGCGSGILGIAALLLGAEKIVAVDNDPQALQATGDNLRRNQLGEQRLNACLPDALPQQIHAEVVIANILAQPLIELSPVIGAMVKPGGRLCLSGMTTTQVDSVMAAYPGFIFDPPASMEGWALVRWARLTATKSP